MLHVEWGAVLGLVLGLLSVQTAVQTTVTILCKKCVDGLYPGLSAKNKKERKHGKNDQTTICKATIYFLLTMMGFP